MLDNLNRAILQKGLAKNALATSLGIAEKSFYNKLYGDTDFSFNGARKLRESFFPEYDFEYLFSDDTPDEKAG